MNIKKTQIKIVAQILGNQIYVLIRKIFLNDSWNSRKYFVFVQLDNFHFLSRRQKIETNTIQIPIKFH